MAAWVTVGPTGATKVLAYSFLLDETVESFPSGVGGELRTRAPGRAPRARTPCVRLSHVEPLAWFPNASALHAQLCECW